MTIEADESDPQQPDRTIDLIVTADESPATSAGKPRPRTRRVLFHQGVLPTAIGTHPYSFSSPPLEGVKPADDDGRSLPLSITG